MSLKRWARSFHLVKQIQFSKNLPQGGESYLKSLDGDQNISIKIPTSMENNWKDFVRRISPRLKNAREETMAFLLEKELKTYIFGFYQGNCIKRNLCVRDNLNGKIEKICIKSIDSIKCEKEFFRALKQNALEITKGFNTRFRQKSIQTEFWIYLRDFFSKNSDSNTDLYINSKTFCKKIQQIFTIHNENLLIRNSEDQPTEISSLINIPKEDISLWINFTINIPEIFNVKSDMDLKNEYLKFHAHSDPYSPDAVLNFYYHKCASLVAVNDVIVDSSEFDQCLSNSIGKLESFKECTFSIDSDIKIDLNQLEFTLNKDILESFFAYYFTTYDISENISQEEYTKQVLRDITNPILITEFSGNYFFNESKEQFIEISSCGEDFLRALNSINNQIKKYEENIKPSPEQTYITLSPVDFKNHKIFKCKDFDWNRYVAWIFNNNEEKKTDLLLTLQSEYANYRSDSEKYAAKFKAALALAIESTHLIEEWIISENIKVYKRKTFLGLISIVILSLGIIFNLIFWLKIEPKNKDSMITQFD